MNEIADPLSIARARDKTLNVPKFSVELFYIFKSKPFKMTLIFGSPTAFGNVRLRIYMILYL